MTEQTSPNPQQGQAALTGLKTRLGIVGELFAFLWAAKMWWLIPMVIALIIFAAADRAWARPAAAAR